MQLSRKRKANRMTETVVTLRQMRDYALAHPYMVFDLGNDET